MYQSLTRSIKIKRKRQIANFKNERGTITKDPTDIKRVIKGYCKKNFMTIKLTTKM